MIRECRKKRNRARWSHDKDAQITIQELGEC